MRWTRLLGGLGLLAFPLAAPMHGAVQEPERRPAKAFRIKDARDHVEDLTWTVYGEHLFLAEVEVPQWENRCARSLARLLKEEPDWRQEAGLDDPLPPWPWSRLVRRLLHPSQSLTMRQLHRRRDVMARAVLEALGDPHSHRQDLKGDSALAAWFLLTTGLSLAQDAEGLFLDLVIVGSDGHRKGLRPGDRLLALNQQPADNLTLRRAQDLIESACSLRVQRPGWERAIDLHIRNMNVATLRPVGAMLPGDIGYLRYPIFDGSAIVLQQEVRRLHRRGASAWILDLRGNPGGLLIDGQTLADVFLEEGAHISWITERALPDDLPEPDPEDLLDEEASQEDPAGASSDPPRTGAPDGSEVPGATGADRAADPDEGPLPLSRYWMNAASHPAIPVEEPMVVLVDASTASAAELVAIALQSNRRALVVGRPSYGKGVGQSATLVMHHREFAPRLPPPGAQRPEADGTDLDPDPDPDPNPERRVATVETQWVYQYLWLSTFRFESPRRDPQAAPGVTPDLRVDEPQEPPELVELLARLWDDSTLLAALGSLEIHWEESDTEEKALPSPVSLLLADHGFPGSTPHLAEAVRRLWQGREEAFQSDTLHRKADPDLQKAIRAIEVQRRRR